MNFKAKLILLCLILILFNVGAVSAHDNNLTNESWEVETQDNILRLNSDFKQNEMIQLDNVDSSNDMLSADNINESIKPTINDGKLDITLSPVNTNIFVGEKFAVRFVDPNGDSYANLPVFIRVDGKNFKSLTDGDGFAVFSLSKDSGVFSVELIYLGNARYNPYSKVVKISLQKYDVILTPISTALIGGDHLRVSFKDQFNNSYANLPVFVKVDGKNFKSLTDVDGFVVFSLSKDSGVFSVELIYLGNARYNPYSEVVKISLQKYNVTLTPLNTSVVAGNPFKVQFKDQFGKSYANLPVFIKVDGRNFKAVTDKEGYAYINADVNSGKSYSAELIYQGNKQYNPFSEKCQVTIIKKTSITIYNDKLLKGGYLRIHLQSDEFWAVSKQTLTIKIGAKTFVEKTNSEGIVIIKPNMTKKTYTVDVTFNGTKTMTSSHKSKSVEGIYGYAINPLYKDVPSKGGVPDIDYMTEDYVRADGDMTYTVLKSQYKEVLQRDSYCLFLNNRLTEYVLFKTKSAPTLYHVVHRTKWNVLERELFKSLVLKNQHDYWPSEITASLKGKAYTYSEVRDVQNTDYTCGPTSCSMCSQVLRNYYCESYLARLSGSEPDVGTSVPAMDSALEKNNFKCSYFYRSSYDYALSELKKGGCAVVFHAKNHYVAILDISKDGNYVLVSNSYGSYDNIETGWQSTNYMKTRYYKNYDDGLIVRLSYSLSPSTKNEINQFYHNMGSWTRQNTNENILVDY